MYCIAVYVLIITLLHPVVWLMCLCRLFLRHVNDQEMLSSREKCAMPTYPINVRFPEDNSFKKETKTTWTTPFCKFVLAAAKENVSVAICQCLHNFFGFLSLESALEIQLIWLLIFHNSCKRSDKGGKVVKNKISYFQGRQHQTIQTKTVSQGTPSLQDWAGQQKMDEVFALRGASFCRWQRWKVTNAIFDCLYWLSQPRFICCAILFAAAVLCPLLPATAICREDCDRCPDEITKKNFRVLGYWSLILSLWKGGTWKCTAAHAATEWTFYLTWGSKWCLHYSVIREAMSQFVAQSTGTMKSIFTLCSLTLMSPMHEFSFPSVRGKKTQKAKGLICRLKCTCRCRDN